MVSNLYLKFSELQLLDGETQPFSSIYGATCSAVLTEFMSPQEIMDASEEDLLQFIASKSRKRIADVSKTSELLKKAARDSYRLDQCMYESQCLYHPKVHSGNQTWLKSDSGDFTSEDNQTSAQESTRAYIS